MLAVYFVSGVRTFYDPDMFHCLTLARETVAEGRVPLEDRFAYTPTRFPVVHHEWAEALLVYGVSMGGGRIGLTLFKYAVEFATVGGALLLAWRQGAGIATLTMLGPLGLLMSWPGMTSVRAQVLTLFFTVLLLWFLDEDRRGRRWWMVPYVCLHVVWLNCHGGFVVGPALLVLHALEQGLSGRPIRHLLLLLPVLAALVVVNPYGLAYYTYLRDALTMDRSAIGEWQPLGRDNPGALPIWLVSVLVWLYCLRRVGWREMPGWLLVGVTAVLALRHQRHVSLYALVWLAHIPPAVQRARLGVVLERLWKARPAVTTAILLVVIAWRTQALAAARVWELYLPANPGDRAPVVYPVGAVAYLDQVGFRGNLLVPFEMGAFVSWKLHPRVKVSFDGRYEAAYGHALLVQHAEFYNRGPRWKEMLTAHPTDAALVQAGWPVEPAMRSEDGWRLVYEDDAYRLFVRRDLALPYVDRRGTRLQGTFP